MPLVAPGGLGGTDPQETARHICTYAFINFRGYLEDDGSPVPNTIQNRLELYSSLYISESIKTRLIELNFKATRGEVNQAPSGTVGSPSAQGEA